MRHEKLNDIITLVIESTDERTAVMNWLYYHLDQQYQQPIVVVLPQDAVFRRPGDLRELQQVTAQHDARLVLVIEGNERLRLWARRHGFTVFSTVETCHRALNQRGNPPSWPSLSDGIRVQSEVRPVIEQSPVTSFTGQWNSYEGTDAGTQGETYHTALATVATATSRRASGQFTPASRTAGQVQVAERPFTPRVTEPLLLNLPTYGSVKGGERVREVRARATVALVEKEYDTPFLPDVEFSLDIPVPAEETGKVAAISTAVAPSPLRAHFLQLQQDKLLLTLVALVILGILGGIGFSYLLQVVQSTPSHQLPVSLIQAIWGI
ncbi:hypothetical protein KDW_11210 [Dictyobacter vulcani]|uniref:Uncharacterized protein n=1 Tax=Dictyobacter vulcani TaxID=2607529 RepID=A0A5J4KLB6_9CHLR|nr:hypothetical protein [Dictyobacter vulcani]GER86959.1 hypothetical protein KDW_11210 [Dictyobacter vulcani]